VGRIAPNKRTEETGGAWSALHQLDRGPEVNKNGASEEQEAVWEKRKEEQL
jgi:hypothetical protein